MAIPLRLCALAVAAGVRGADPSASGVVCPSGTVQMGTARAGSVLACEDLMNRAGYITFVDTANGSALTLSKTAEHLYVDPAGLYCGYNKSQVAASIKRRGSRNGTAGSDILGDKILTAARAANADPTLAEVSAVLAPLVYDGKLTRNLPLLAIPRPVRTDCLWF